MKYIFGNWKMYLDFAESHILAHELLLKNVSSTDTVGVAVFPTALAVPEVIKAFSGSSIAVGAQNVAWVPKGAYTGAVSAQMFKDVGCSYALVGHSERRIIFGETDGAVRKKVEAALDAGLVPVVCVGETKEEREAGKQETRVKEQLQNIFEGLVISSEQTVLIAYEPVWAIGTGAACDAAEAAIMHTVIKREVEGYIGRSVPVLYGGSVDEKNVVSYLTLDPIDGVLVGNASTHSTSFIRMIELAQQLS